MNMVEIPTQTFHWEWSSPNFESTSIIALSGWCPGAMTTAVEIAAASKINCKVSRSPTWGLPGDHSMAINRNTISPWQSQSDPPKVEKMSYDWLPTVWCANDSMIFFGHISGEFLKIHNPCLMLWGFVGLEKTLLTRESGHHAVYLGLREPFGMFHHPKSFDGQGCWYGLRFNSVGL